MMMPKKFIILLFCLWGAALLAEHHYTIEARLDPLAKMVRGTMEVAWTNPGQDTVQTVPFHLYMNAFKDRRSSFMQEGRLYQLELEEEPERQGICRITACSVDGVDALSSGRFQAPDDGNLHDRTVWELTLPEAVGPGETITVRIDFLTKLPKIVTRTGHAGDFFLVAQWFPKVGLWLDGKGWVCHQFHAYTEFFDPFADYDVTIDVPADFIVAAAGVLEGSELGEDRTVYRFRADRVHDFVWAASPDFVRVTDTFTPEKDLPPHLWKKWSKILGLGEDEYRAIRPVKIDLYAPPDHAAKAVDHLKAARAAMAFTAMWYGPYPYEHLTIIDPPIDAINAGGMEYPTFFTTFTFPLQNVLGLSGWKFPETATIHEFTHNYFQGMVATDEVDEACLDEGFTTFTEGAICTELWGPKDLRIPWLNLFLSPKERLILAHTMNRQWDPVNHTSWRHISYGSYAFNSYEKTSLILWQLRDLLGEERFWRLLREYAVTYRYKHPSVEDFLAILSAREGESRKVQVARWLEDDTRVDYRVFRAREHEEHWTVTVGREGTPPGIPVEVVVRFENDSEEHLIWDGTSRWTRWRFNNSRGDIVSVDVDPEWHIFFDTCRANNTWRSETQEGYRHFLRRAARVVARILGEVTRWFG